MVWATQRMTAELFDCSVDNISLHLKNPYAEGELNLVATIEEFSTVQTEGGAKEIRKAYQDYLFSRMVDHMDR